MRDLLVKIGQGVNYLLWPSLCSCCGVLIAETANGLCSRCWDELMFCVGGDYCPGCGREASKYGIIDGRCAGCRQEKLYFDGIARAGAYDRVLRDMILSFKFQERTEMTDVLGSMADSAMQGCFFRDQIDQIVPVPLHWRRRFERGYNQATLITKRLNCDAKICEDLVRIRYTQRQWNLPAETRRTNVKGAFAVRKRHPFAGKNICLVDDITTSWATLNECAKTLKEAGAEKVFAVVVAVAAEH